MDKKTPDARGGFFAVRRSLFSAFFYQKLMKSGLYDPDRVPDFGDRSVGDRAGAARAVSKRFPDTIGVFRQLSAPFPKRR